MSSPPHLAPPVVLAIAGFDPSSGAGITADLQTFAAHGLYGTACATALTVQSTLGVVAVHAVAPEILAATLACLEADLPPAGIKIGMLGSAAAIATVASFLETVRRARPVPVVLDPVLRSSSGAPLLDPDALSLLRDRLLPLCDIATPNRAELARLTGHPPGHHDLPSLAALLQPSIGGRTVLVTGGDEQTPDDLLLHPSGAVEWLRGIHIESTSTHGTGCAFSSALLAHLVRGHPLSAAAHAAKHFVEQGIARAPGLGHGRGPLQLLWPLLSPQMPPGEK